MASWSDVEVAEPELASQARACFTATTNAVLGTIRADGSPRLSGIDPRFHDGELWLGSMADARKGADLRRDPRLALHSIPWESRRAGEGEAAPDGDAKLTGQAVLVTDPETFRRVMGDHEDTTYEVPTDSDLFRIEVHELVLISVEADELVVDRWSAAAGRRVVRRA